MSTSLYEQALRLLSESHELLCTEHEDECERYHIDRNFLSPGELNELKVFLAQDSKILFISHVGTGKTTELHHLKFFLEKEGFYVVFLPSSHFGNMDHLSYETILLLIIKKTVELISSYSSLRVNKELLQNIMNTYRALAGEDIQIDRQTTSGNSRSLLSVIKDQTKFSTNVRQGHVQGTAREELLEHLKSDFNSLILSVKDLNKRKICIMIDDFKVKDPTRVSNLLVGGRLDSLKCCMLLTIPRYIFHDTSFNEVRDEYKLTYMLPLFEVYNKNGDENLAQIALMEKIIRKRILEEILPRDVIILSAKLSGGHLSTFLFILKLCCARADKNHGLNTNIVKDIFTKHVVTKFEAFRQEKYVGKLIGLHRTKSPLYHDSDFIFLLSEMAVLGYKEGSEDAWFDVNPALVNDILERERKPNIRNRLMNIPIPE